MRDPQGHHALSEGTQIAPDEGVGIPAGQHRLGEPVRQRLDPLSFFLGLLLGVQVPS